MGKFLICDKQTAGLALFCGHKIPPIHPNGTQKEGYPMGSPPSVRTTCKLFNRVHNFLESLGVVHCQVGENLAVHLDTLSVALTHKLGIGQTVHTSGSVDTLNPQATVVPLLLFAVAIGELQTFLDSIFGYCPDISP